jgi:CheY-like chemotaxis protein
MLTRNPIWLSRLKGIGILEAGDAAEAARVEAANAEPIDLLLTDIMMPGLTGPELARQLSPRRPRMKILYMSAFTVVDLANQRIQLDPGVPVLAKPFSVDALTKKVVSDATEQPTVQRQVSEMLISSAGYVGPGDEVKVSHILYTPDGKTPDPNAPYQSNDPGWGIAKAKAQATLDKLKALPADQQAAQFAAIAKTDSQDTASGANGGTIDWLSQSSLDPSFGDAVFQDGLKKGDLIGPVQSQYGWHVVLFEGRRGSPESRIAALQAQANAPGADFAQLAKDDSDGPDASTGGDLGWVAHYQLDEEREKAIFAAPVGKVSDQLQTSGGY